MKFGIFTNLKRDIGAKYSLKLIEMLKNLKIDFRVCDNASAFVEKSFPIGAVASWADMMIVFGGDGTMLEIGRICAKKNIPVFGINSGNLGFLSDVSVSDLEQGVENLINGNFAIDERDVLNISINGEDFLAINEVIIGRTNSHHITRFKIYIDDKLADVISADGVMVSTPTGSTAYSLSCNGPILEPKLQAFVINSVCPHSLHTRPMVIANTAKIKLVACLDGDGDISIIADGERLASLAENTEIMVYKSLVKAKFVKMKDTNFYKRLLEKLKYWNEVNDL